MSLRTPSLGRAAVAMFLVLWLGALAPGSQLRSQAAPSPSELRAAEERLQQLEREFELVVERYNLVRERLQSIQVRIGGNEIVARRLSGRLGSTEDSAAAVAEQLYKSGTTGALEVVLSSSSLDDIQSRLQYLQSSEEAQIEVFERLSVDRAELDAALAQLEKDRAQALESQQQLDSLRTEIEDKVASQRAEIIEINAAIERAERRREAREAARAAAAAEAARAAEAAAARAAQEAAAQAAEEPAAQSPTPDVSIAPAPAPSERARVAVEAALDQVGKPYQWGAAGPDSFDCSGLMMWSWAQAGVALPHNSGAQYAATTRVEQSDWQPGDLLFAGSPIHHVGMYIGNGQMVEAPYTGAYVRVVSAYRSDYAGAGRPGV
ncbi:MAG: NlpC/P60 family protein [Actinomycetota bacterium]|nr:NlpC/P60 family protein [Actinomycetota bacterium]